MKRLMTLWRYGEFTATDLAAADLIGNTDAIVLSRSLANPWLLPGCSSSSFRGMLKTEWFKIIVAVLA